MLIWKSDYSKSWKHFVYRPMVSTLHEFMKWSWSLWKLIFICIICKFLYRISQKTCFSINKTGHLRHCVRKYSLFIAKITRNTEILPHCSRKMQFWMLLQVIRIASPSFKYLRQSDTSGFLSFPLLTCHERYSDLDDKNLVAL